MDVIRDPAIESGKQALPRDVSRFKKLYPNGRAVIRANPDSTLGCISTAELLNQKLTSSDETN